MQTRMFIGMICVTALLQGCMSAAVTGAQTIYNRHGIEKNMKDQYIALQVHRKLEIDNKAGEFRNANMTVAAYDGEVLLAGQVPEVWQRQRAEELVKQIPDVKRVYNLIKIASPASTLTLLSDVWLTTKVKAKMIAANDLDGSQVKVVSENGTVYLMGIVPPEQAERAAEIASSTGGVRDVVKMFSYITISKQAYRPILPNTSQ